MDECLVMNEFLSSPSRIMLSILIAFLAAVGVVTLLGMLLFGGGDDTPVV